MTEAEWQDSTDTHELFHQLRWWSRPTERKHRLFACAVCRQHWPFLSDLGRYAVELSEAAADGQTPRAPGDRLAVAHDLLNEYNALRAKRDRENPPTLEAQVALIAYAVVAPGSAGVNAASDAVRNIPDETVPVVKLIRDIFGNPFRHITFSPEWRTSTAIAIAQQMYESRDFSPMPILADALQDAGCDNADILNHCRDEQQVHVRGCWVADMVLSKE